MPSVDEDPRAEHARELRRAGLSLREIRAELGPIGNERLRVWLQGVPPAEWTRRPTAKDQLRAKARELRRDGGRVQEIAAQLGVSKSTVSVWVRDLPPPSPRSVEHVRQMSERRWAPIRRERNVHRQQVKFQAAREVGSISPRELYLVGAALYWAEGAKDKHYARREKVSFCNSDPTMITTFLAWLALVGTANDRIQFRLQIHETADASAALGYWADIVQRPLTDFCGTTLKRHNPKTNRRRQDETYHGCLTVDVLNSAELYRKLEGAWYGISYAASDVHRERVGMMPGVARE